MKTKNNGSTMKKYFVISENIGFSYCAPLSVRR